jgi:hypothetical protein
MPVIEMGGVGRKEERRGEERRGVIRSRFCPLQAGTCLMDSSNSVTIDHDTRLLAMQQTDTIMYMMTIEKPRSPAFDLL